MPFLSRPLSLAFLLLLVGLAACSSVSIGYRSAPTLAGWWIDRQLDLPAAHRAAVDRALVEVHLWHAGELRQSLALLLRATGQRLAGAVSENDARQLIAALEAHADGVSMRFARALAAQLPPLDPAQLGRIAARISERQRDYAEERLAGGPAAQDRRRRERIEDAADEWFGSVSRVQRGLMARSAASGVFDERIWVAERERRLQALLRALGPGAVKVVGGRASGLERWFADWRRDRSPEVAAAMAAQREAGIRLWLALLDAATPDQRRHLRERLDGWADDLDSAARQILLVDAAD